MIIGLVCLMTMMTGTSMKFFEEYQRAGERISAEATEYVRGIPVVKVFQQTVYSFKSFHAAILSYRDLASGYAMMCRMPLHAAYGGAERHVPVSHALGNGSHRRRGRRLGGAGRSGVLHLLRAPACPL